MSPSRPCLILALCLGLLAGAIGSAAAQQLERDPGGIRMSGGDALPPWVVPVLRLVSATHVQPTTGIVLSDSGRVLVPEPFASVGDEIIVLDGGTDIIRHGRPARIEMKFNGLGLQVLAVDGMRRQGPELAASLPDSGAPLELTAFPPAEQIAEGAPPLRLPTRIVRFAENAAASVSAESPLPNVTGALIDACGYLVAVSLADGIQTMEPSGGTRYRWREDLLEIYRALDMAPSLAACAAGQAEAREAGQPPTEPASAAPEPEAAAPQPEETPPEPEPVGPEAEEPESGAEEPDAETPAVEALEILPPIESDGPMETAGEAGSEDEGPLGWAWVIAALALIGLGLLLHRWRSGMSEPPAGAGDSSAASDRTADEPSPEADAADLSELDSIMVIKGVLADGSTFERSCPVSRHAINLVIGRGGVDLRVDSPTVSRQHARLDGKAGSLTVSDLGSSNGTSINGVPCLEEEIMYIEAGDTLILGDTRCWLELRPASEDRGDDA
jgi:hypothetical protein